MDPYPYATPLSFPFFPYLPARGQQRGSAGANMARIILSGFGIAIGDTYLFLEALFMYVRLEDA